MDIFFRHLPLFFSIFSVCECGRWRPVRSIEDVGVGCCRIVMLEPFPVRIPSSEQARKGRARVEKRLLHHSCTQKEEKKSSQKRRKIRKSNPQASQAGVCIGTSLWVSKKLLCQTSYISSSSKLINRRKGPYQQHFST